MLQDCRVINIPGFAFKITQDAEARQAALNLQPNMRQFYSKEWYPG